MTHLSETNHSLFIHHRGKDLCQLEHELSGFNDVCLVVLPLEQQWSNQKIQSFFAEIEKHLGSQATLITVGDVADLVHVQSVFTNMTYQLWISIKRQTILHDPENRKLPSYHFGALVHTKYTGSLKHTDTRIKYTFCPACQKTTKDYGGKKHTYNSYGTLISDIWRDIECDLEGNLTEVFKRFADLFGLENYQELRILDFRENLDAKLQISENAVSYRVSAQPVLFRSEKKTKTQVSGRLINGDCLENLKTLPDDSIDFAFIDPPYNLKKTYNNYADDLSIKEYFSWCDEWIGEIVRILRPGKTLAILNLPLWAIRHFLFMETHLIFQNWIAWDALSFPVRRIMPAHYGIICFSKGESRPLPGLAEESVPFHIENDSPTFHPLEPLAEWYCLRSTCVRNRNQNGFTDRGILTDLWWDIHRLKHNSRRVDHPCQLPPQLLYRLISIFTEPEETVLDCFNGAGTTTLAAHQLGRNYIGIELSEKYYQIAKARHEEIERGINPFRKANRNLTEKNSRVPRMANQRYEVPKKTLQLEVRRVAEILGRLPSRNEMIEYGKYSIRYYDEYFASWGEVCAAARHDGMNETKIPEMSNGSNVQATQLGLFDRGLFDAKRK